MKRIKVFIAITMSLVLFLTGVGNLSVEAVKKSVSAKITFWDVKGNKQKIKKEKVNKKPSFTEGFRPKTKAVLDGSSKPLLLFVE